MIVIVHQTPSITMPELLINLAFQQINEALAINIIHNNVLPRVAPRGDVVNGAGEFQS